MRTIFDCTLQIGIKVGYGQVFNMTRQKLSKNNQANSNKKIKQNNHKDLQHREAW